MSFTPLSSTNHSNLCLTRGTFFHLQNRPFVPISTVEAQRAGLDLPLAFSRTKKGLSLVAILSLNGEDNAQVGPKGLWMGGYMPAVVRAYPFALAYHEDKATVLVDTKSDWLSESEGQPLFEEDGSASEVLDRLINLLKTQAPNPHRDKAILQAIDRSGVLEPWSQVSENLLRVEPKKLYELSNEDLVRLRSALPVLYAQLMSMPRINRVKNLARRKQKMTQQEQVSPEDILSSFEEDDILRFNDE